MSSSLNDLASKLLSLPADQRAALAQQLWASVEGSTTCESTDIQTAAVSAAMRRDRQLSASNLEARVHEDVMDAARRALQCE
ncbi:MAG: hypothetical protein GTO41_05805 [Burkholderiales bacterium]|nr:hypothetical protein [Burkholderiales bacterium]